MGAWRAVAAAAIGAGTCVALVVQAAADEPRDGTSALTWSAPAECPDEASVRAGVAQLLVGSSAKVDGHAEVRRSGERWQVVVTMNGGERRLEADSCRALADATALIVAMAVDPERVAANRSAQDAGVASGSLPTAAATVADASADATPAIPQDAAPPPAPPLPLPPPLPPSHPVPPATSTPPSTLLHFAVSAAATGDFGTLPAPAFGPSLGLAWTPGHFRLELAGAYFPSSSASIPGSGTAPASTAAGTAQFSLVSASLRLCYVVHLASFELGPCAGAEAGSLQGTSRGILAPASGASALFAFDAGLLAAWHFAEAWAVFARGDALLQTFRPTFDVTAGTDDAVLNTPGLVTGRGSLGVELRF